MAAASKKSRKTAPKKQPDKVGRPPFGPTVENRKTVKAMAGYGIPQDDIALVVGIDPKTLRKHFGGELDTGATIATAKVAESLYTKATGDGNSAVTAAIFWLKTRAGWTEKTNIGFTDNDGNDRNFSVNLVPANKPEPD